MDERRRKRKTILYAGIFLLIVGSLLSSSNPGQSESDQSDNSIPDHKAMTRLLDQRIILNLTHTQFSSTLNLSAKVPSTITPEYVFVTMRLAYIANPLSISTIQFGLDNENRTLAYLRKDGVPEQIILEFSGIKLDPTSTFQIQFINRIPFQVGIRDFDNSFLIIEGIELYLITPPIKKPIIIPMNQVINRNSGIFNYLSEMIMFLPQNQKIRIILESLEKIQIEGMTVEEAKWIGEPLNANYNTKHNLTIQTRDQPIYNWPKRGQITINPLIKTDLLRLNVTAQVIEPEPLPEEPHLTVLDEIQIAGVLNGMALLPLAKLAQDRRKTGIIKK